MTPRKRVGSMVVLATVVACGGDGGDANCSFFSNVCEPVPGPGAPQVAVEPWRATVAAGSPASFTAIETTGLPGTQAWSWCVTPPSGGACVPVAGASSATLRLDGLGIADSGSVVQATVHVAAQVGIGWARVFVASASGPVFSDGDFVSWSSVADPAGAPVEAGTQPGDGNPGAWRRVAFVTPGGAATLRVHQLATTAHYDPATDGAVLSIDYGMDCTAPGAPDAAELSLLLEQAGRRYRPNRSFTEVCGSGFTTNRHPSLLPDEFVQIDGPACASGAACPDLTATGAPLAFGFSVAADASAGAASAAVVRGVDNWRVQVWKR